MEFLIVKIICLFLAIWLTSVNTYRSMLDLDVCARFMVAQALFITAFITMQWLI